MKCCEFYKTDLWNCTSWNVVNQDSESWNSKPWTTVNHELPNHELLCIITLWIMNYCMWVIYHSIENESCKLPCTYKWLILQLHWQLQCVLHVVFSTVLYLLYSCEVVCLFFELKTVYKKLYMWIISSLTLSSCVCII